MLRCKIFVQLTAIQRKIIKNLKVLIIKA